MSYAGGTPRRNPFNVRSTRAATRLDLPRRKQRSPPPGKESLSLGRPARDDCARVGPRVDRLPQARRTREAVEMSRDPAELGRVAPTDGREEVDGRDSRVVGDPIGDL